MSFSIITSNPTWGVESTATISLSSYPPIEGLGVAATDLALSDLACLMSGSVNTSGINKPLGGWITYTGGGGGGSTRPATGMLYPRGQG